MKTGRKTREVEIIESSVEYKNNKMPSWKKRIQKKNINLARGNMEKEGWDGGPKST